MSALRLALAATVITAALAYSHYGFPGHRHATYGFEPFHRFGGYGSYGGWPYQEEVYRPPCPQYRPLDIRGWEEIRTPYGGGYELSVMLPGVHPEHRRVELAEDGEGIHLIGYRQVPTRGRMRALECLPEDARLSRDGRYEILEAMVPIPQAADASRASVRHGRNGLQISVPMRPPPARTPSAAPCSTRRPPEGMPNRGPQPSPAELPRSRRPGISRPSPGSPRAPPQAAATEVQQPRTDGIEITEEEYPYPEKDPDAAEGWFDNRNEFQLY